MPPRSPSDEIMTPVPTVEALRQAEVLAMRQISDNLGAQNRVIEKLVERVEDVRDKVIALEAQELKSLILAVKADLAKEIADGREHHDRDLKSLRDELERTEAELAASINTVRESAHTNARAIAGLKGVFMPLMSAGAAILAAIAGTLASLFIAHR